MAVHSYPVNDLIEHVLTGGALCDCPCGPDVFFEDGGVHVAHHSLDGREFAERGEEIPRGDHIRS